MYTRHESRKVERPYWIGKFSHRVFGEVGSAKTDDNWLDSVHFLTGGSQCPGKFSTWKREWKFFFSLEQGRTSLSAVRHLLLDIFLFSVRLSPEIWSLDGIRNDACKEPLRTSKARGEQIYPPIEVFVSRRIFVLIRKLWNILGIPRYFISFIY